MTEAELNRLLFNGEAVEAALALFAENQRLLSSEPSEGERETRRRVAGAAFDMGASIADKRDAEIAALKADLEAARATIASLAEKIAQAVEDDTKRMREQIEERRMFREIGSYSRMRFNRLLPRLHDRKDVSLTECFDLLDADLAAHKRALAAGPAALRAVALQARAAGETILADGALDCAANVEAAQEAAMKEWK